MSGYSSYQTDHVAVQRPHWRWPHWVVAAIVALIPMAGGFITSMTLSTDSYKRDAFKQPDWAPPSWLFGPVWTVLYLMMGIASVLIVRYGGIGRETAVPLILYVLQLLANWTWSPLFFGAGLISLALVDIGIMLGLIFACILTFFPVSKVAAVMLVPYFMWVSFATALNHAIVCLNGCTIDHTVNATATAWSDTAIQSGNVTAMFDANGFQTV